MSARDGIFWRAVTGEVPLPRAAQTLGFHLIRADVEAGTIEVGFTATDDFTNPFGEVLGGFLGAMLYDTVGPAVLATLGAGRFIVIDELTTSFHHPTRARAFVGHGRLGERRGDEIVVDAELVDDAGVTVATARARVRVVDATP